MAAESSSVNTAAALDLPSGPDDYSTPGYYHGGFQGCAGKLLSKGRNKTVSSLELS